MFSFNLFLYFQEKGQGVIQHIETSPTLQNNSLCVSNGKTDTNMTIYTQKLLGQLKASDWKALYVYTRWYSTDCVQQCSIEWIYFKKIIFA